MNAYGPVTANVIERDLSLWYLTIKVDKGSADGVKAGDPVVGAGGLVGDVSQVGPNFSVVTEITSDKFAAAALVEDAAGDTGELVPDVGNPNELLLTTLPPHAQISYGQQVVTAGFKDSTNPKLQDPCTRLTSRSARCRAPTRTP